MMDIDNILELLSSEDHLDISYDSDSENGEYGNPNDDHRIQYCSAEAETALTEVLSAAGMQSPEHIEHCLPPEYIDCIQQVKGCLDPVAWWGAEEGEPWSDYIEVKENRSLGDFLDYLRDNERNIFDAAILAAEEYAKDWKPNPDNDETEDDRPSHLLNPMMWPELVRRMAMILITDKLANTFR